MNVLRSREGMALVLVLAVLAVITAVVTEFAYGVYVNTTLLYNWQASQRLSLVGESGTSIAASLIRQNYNSYTYTYPGTFHLPAFEPFNDGTFVALTVEDETSKFNLNRIIYSGVGQTGNINEQEQGFPAFLRLLGALDIEDEEELADRILDWIDRDELPRTSGSEDGAKNAPFQSVEELLLIPGVGREGYDKLKPYVTVFGNGKVNINGAQAPVLMSVHKDITMEMAQGVVDYRDIQPFTTNADIKQVAGFSEVLYTAINNYISVKGTAFSVTSSASTAEELKRDVTCVIDSNGSVLYWKEM